MEVPTAIDEWLRCRRQLHSGKLGVRLCVGVFCFLCGFVVTAFGWFGFGDFALHLEVVLGWVDRCFGSWALYGLFSTFSV